MARPVVPIPVGRGVVRVDVARTIVRTIVHVPTATNGTHHVTINEVGVKKTPSRRALQSRMWKIIAFSDFLRLFLEENYVFRMKFLWRERGLRPPLPLARQSPPLGEVKARPEVPRPEGRGVDRENGARTRDRTRVHGPTATNGTHHVTSNEVGVVAIICRG